MATANAAALNELANDFAIDFASATLTIKGGSTTLATHTLTGFGTAASGAVTASAIANATVSATGTADSAEITASGKTYTLTVGTSNADLIVSNTSFVSGGVSEISSLVVTFS